jgi:hypothetical protein
MHIGCRFAATSKHCLGTGDLSQHNFDLRLAWTPDLVAGSVVPRCQREPGQPCAFLALATLAFLLDKESILNLMPYWTWVFFYVPDWELWVLYSRRGVLINQVRAAVHHSSFSFGFRYSLIANLSSSFRFLFLPVPLLTSTISISFEA